MDRHLNRLGHDLEQVDEPGGGSSTSRSSMPGRYSRMRKYWLGLKGGCWMERSEAWWDK